MARPVHWLIAFALCSSIALAAACDVDADCTAAPATACSCGVCVNPATWYQPQCAAIQESWVTWGPVSFIAVTIAFLVAGLAYMLGVGFDNRGLKTWGKVEFYQALASAVLAGSLLMLASVMLDRGSGLLLGANVNPFTVSGAYLDDLSVTLQELYSKVYAFNYAAEFLTSLSIYTNLAPGADISPFLGLLTPLISVCHTVGSYVVQSYILIGTWRGLLDFALTVPFTAFLPLGVFLRIFPITRGAGGLLIALAIGLFFVFPTMLAFIAIISDDEHALAAELDAVQPAPDISSDLLSKFNACDQDLESVMRTGDALTSPSVVAQMNAFAAFLPAIMLKLFFFPIVVMAATVTFIRTAAPLLGSDVAEVGAGIMRLI